MGFKNPYSARLEEFAAFVNPACESWDAFFHARMGKIPQKTILEIGCSNAGFLSEIARAHPETAFIGVDWKFKILYKGAKRVDQEKLLNVALLRGRIQELVKESFQEESLDEVWIFFPDPWAKKAQLKHRLMREDFLLDLHCCLKPGGKVHFKTDHPGYFQWVLALFGQPAPSLSGGRYAEASAAATASGERGYRLKQVRVRKTEASEDLPEPSRELLSRFRVVATSSDYWHAPRKSELFSETQTLFEKVFVKDGLPIYFVELEKSR